MADTSPITDTPEIRQQIERIFASKSFRRRQKLRNLLEYLVAETLAGRAAELTQKKIATDVYGMQDSFDPASDGTVRISAGRLRTSLHDYYKNEAGPGE